MKVRNMRGTSGREVPNQFIVEGDKIEIFQSYETTIAIRHKDSGKVVLDKHKYDFSSTTSRYLNKFLGVDSKTKKENVKSGKYELKELN